MNLIKKIFAVVLILAILAAIVFLILQMQMHRILTDTEAARKADKPLPVNVYEVNKGLLEVNIPTEGVLQTNYLIPISSLSGQTERVAKTFVKVGDRVKKRKALLQLDDKLARMELKQAKEELKSLTKEIEERRRYMEWTRKNRQKGIGLERNYRERLIELVHAQGLAEKVRHLIDLKQWEIKEKYITAPAKGVIVEVVQAGQVLQANNTTLVSIAAVDPIILSCKISEEKLGFVKIRQPVEVSFDSFPGRVFYSKISRILPLPTENAEERAVIFTVELANPYGKLLPGLHGIVHIKKQKQALRIPNIALFNSDFYNAQVFVVNNEGIAHIKQIRTGLSAEGYTEVVGGLQKGERVVIAGQLKLQDGDKVRIGYQ